MGSRKTSETRDLFNQPAPKARESFSIKNEIEETILNSGGLVIDEIGLNEMQSKKNLGDKFNQIILGVVYENSDYKEYFSVKEHILTYLKRKFPYAQSPALVFEIITHNLNEETKIPLCFAKYGKLDLQQADKLFTRDKLKDFFDKINSGDSNFQKYTIWKDELEQYLNSKQSYSTQIKQEPRTTTKKAQREEFKRQRRLKDNSFPIPELVEGLPYIHTKNGILDIHYMIGLYTRNKIKKVFEDIKEKIEPYNSDWLQEIAKKTIKHFNNYSYNSLISSLAMDENVIKIRERKGRLTMRLKNEIEERNIPEISYNNYYGAIVYEPTQAQYKKELLLNFRPNERKKHVLYRIEERKKYAECMEKLEIITKDFSSALVSIKRGKEMLNISHNDMHMQQSLSLLLPLNEEQQKLQIQKWINELLTISGKESEQKDTEQKNISHEFLIQKLSTILNKCFTDPDDEIEILKELSEELSSINIQILWEEKSVLDRSTGEVLSFDEIYRDGNEYIKLNFLERFTRIKEQESKLQEAKEFSKEMAEIHLPEEITEETTDSNNVTDNPTNNNSRNDFERDDLPF